MHAAAVLFIVLGLRRTRRCPTGGCVLLPHWWCEGVTKSALTQHDITLGVMEESAKCFA